MPSYPLFETIALKDGRLQDIQYHQQRYELGLEYLAKLNNVQNYHIYDLSEEIAIGDQYQLGLYRCRVEYGLQGLSVTIFPYQLREFQCLKIVVDDEIDYQFKYSDRAHLNQLLAKKDHCDEIIIVKNQLVTDCSIGNLLFYKEGYWYTPSTPLLQGTQRARLLAEGKVTRREILVNHIFDYERLMIINALNPFDEQRAFDIKPDNILW